MKASGAVRGEEIRALFEQGSPVLWANLSVGAVVVFALWGSASDLQLLGWYGALASLCGARAALQRRFRVARPVSDELAWWGRGFVLGSGVSGALWGSAALLFFAPGNLLAQGLLTFAIGGMSAAAAGTLSCHLPAFFSFFLPALAPLAASAVLQGDRFHYSMAAILVAYAVGMRRVALNNHRAYSRAVQLGVANTELLEALSSSESELRDANRTLEQRVMERTNTLERQGEALRQAQRLEVAGRLAASLAHDFNSLLTVVINNSSQLKASLALKEHDRLAVEETLEAGQRGAALIRQLLALSRKKPPEPRTFSLNELVTEWAELLRRILGEGVTLHLSLAEAAPRVSADPGYVEQLLLNVVLSTPAATSHTGWLELSTHAPTAATETVQLWVEHAARSPESPDAQDAAPPYPSFDAEVRSRNVGLASVWATARQWNGDVLVEDDAGVVRYRALFPALQEVTAPTEAWRHESTTTPRGATVLVVDDEPTLRAVMRRALLRDGYEVLVAEDGARALKLMADHPGPVDLLLTDVIMPGLSGLELARRLGGQRPGLAVLYVSGFTFEAAVPPTDLEHGVAYLAKPFDTVVLTEKVRELLAAVRAKSALAFNASGG